MDVQARWLRWMGGVLAGTAVLVIILIQSGLFDPKPVGELAWKRPLFSQTIPAHSRQIIWLDENTPAPPYSLRLTAVYESGETDSAYGLVLGNDDDFLTVTVSPLGYTAVREQHSSFIIHHFAFRPWPHVRPDENEIRLDVADGRAAVRINRELLWEGEIDSHSGQVGLWLESWGETAVVNFQTLEMFVE